MAVMALTDDVSSGPDGRRRLPVQFVRVWVVLVVVAAGLELTTRTPYQRVALAAILLVALMSVSPRSGGSGCDGDRCPSGLRRS